MQRVIEPEQGAALVELGVSNFGDVPVPEKTYDSVTWGKILAINEKDKDKYGHLVGREGYWKLYKDDLRIDPHVGATKLVLIELEDIRGSSYESTESTH